MNREFDMNKSYIMHKLPFNYISESWAQVMHIYLQSWYYISFIEKSEHFRFNSQRTESTNSPSVGQITATVIYIQ